MPNFVYETIKIIKGLKMEEQKEFFEQSKEKLIKEFKNFYLEQSFRQAMT